MHSTELLLTLYRKMVLGRRFEEKAGQAYGQKKIEGFCHLYIGQEAVAVGALEALKADDYVLTGYRDHVHALVRGADPGMLMAELFGRDGGYSKGKGGSMHFIDVEHHFYGGYGIVGGQIPLAAGMAFASKYRNEDRVTACFFGDAASNQGAFHETINMAARWKLPVLFIIENNRYGMGTDIRRVSAEPDIHKRAAAFRIPGESVDGMDVLAVHEAVTRLAADARAGKGPAILEAYTYRFRGHSMSDAATYRSKDEVEQEKQKDPIIKLRELLVTKKLARESELEVIDEEQKQLVQQALAFAEASPQPPVEDLWNHVLVTDGEADERPRERVLGATDVVWPTYPTDFEVKWDLEPRPAVPRKKKGAA